MTQMSVGEFKAKFSEALELVKVGEEVEVLYGRNKEPIARLVPVKTKRNGSILGLLEGKGEYYMSDDWEMTYEELISL
ncbi:MAG: hypothetical protein FWG38_11445 [Defluviitaleaceae bacterium]|nr:hypothetical protein [Defluviitaleaceae bacterium]